MPGSSNKRLGWLLLLAGFAAAVGLDAWSLSERDPSALPGSMRMAARHAQAVWLAMGFLQIAVAWLLREDALPVRRRRVAGLVLLVGTLTYVAGYVGLIWWPGSAWLVVIGAAVNLVGFALLGWAACRATVAAEVRVVLAVFLLGMTIDVLSGLHALNGQGVLALDIGPEDGVRQRMLRLARVAATALSLLTLLYRDRAAASATPVANRWGRRAFLVGTAGMPAVLTAACFIHVDLKYLLPIPALAMTGGVLLALWQARQTASPLEQWGWLLIAVSMNVGLLVGLYAFEGPLPAPGFIGAYNDFARRLSRLGHAYCIVFGLLAILLARQASGTRVVVPFLAGSSLTLAATLLLAVWPEQSLLLMPGPVLVTLALLAAAPWCDRPGPVCDVLPGTVPDKERDAPFRERNML